MSNNEFADEDKGDCLKQEIYVGSHAQLSRTNNLKQKPGVEKVGDQKESSENKNVLVDEEKVDDCELKYKSEEEERDQNELDATEEGQEEVMDQKVSFDIKTDLGDEEKVGDCKLECISKEEERDQKEFGVIKPELNEEDGVKEHKESPNIKTELFTGDKVNYHENKVEYFEDGEKVREQKELSDIKPYLEVLKVEDQKELSGIKVNLVDENYCEGEDMISEVETKKHIDLDQREDENSDNSSIDDNELDHLFSHAKKLHRNGSSDKALQELLECLKRATNGESMNCISSCLRMISEIYYKRNEFEKAVQFIQAEKMLYESNLMEIPVEHSGEVDRNDILIREFANLSKLCEKSNELNLALEYQGKATKLCVDQHGYEHNYTTKHLDNFTNLYAKVGKLKYKDSSKKQSAKLYKPAKDKEGIYQRKLNSKGQMVTFANSDQNIIHYIESNRNDRLLTWILNALLFAAMAAILSLVLYIYSQCYHNFSFDKVKLLITDLQIKLAVFFRRSFRKFF